MPFAISSPRGHPFSQPSRIEAHSSLARFLGDSKADVLTSIAAAKNENWLNVGSSEVMVQTVLYNPNTHIFCNVLIRFLSDPSSGINHDVVTWAGVADPRSAEIVAAGGWAWEFRIVLEVIFMLRMIMFFFWELKQIGDCIAKRMRRRDRVRLRSLECHRLADRIFATFVIVIQVLLYRLQDDVRDELISQTALDVQYARFIEIANYYSIFTVFNVAPTGVFRIFTSSFIHPLDSSAAPLGRLERNLPLFVCSRTSGLDLLSLACCSLVPTCKRLKRTAGRSVLLKWRPLL